MYLKKSKSWRMKLQKVHVFKRLTSGVNVFPLKLLSPNKYSWCVWFEQVTPLLLAAANHWHLYQKTLTNKRPAPTLWLLAKKERLYLFWFKLVNIYSRDKANFFISSRKIWFIMVFDFAQTFYDFLFMVITDQLFGYPCVLLSQ